MERRKSIVCESKKIEVERLEKRCTRISESVKGYGVSLDLTDRLPGWLVEKIDWVILNRGKPQEGFISRSSWEDMEIIIRVRRNKAGIFMAILAVSNRFRAGRKFMCIPMGY